MKNKTEKYEHIFDLCFTVENTNEEGSATASELRASLLKRINSLDDVEIVEACGLVD
jgi:hypothetical protein